MESGWPALSFREIKEQIELKGRGKPATAERRGRSGAETIEALEVFIKSWKGPEELLRYADTDPASHKIQAEEENFRRRFQPLAVRFARYLIQAIGDRDIDGIVESAIFFGQVVGEMEEPRRFADRIVRLRSLRIGPKKLSGGDVAASARYSEWSRLYQEAKSKFPEQQHSDWVRYVAAQTGQRKPDGSRYSQRRISDVLDDMTGRKKRGRKGSL
jgi:hypothetical protein